jgi:hypothetical protein
MKKLLIFFPLFFSCSSFSSYSKEDHTLDMMMVVGEIVGTYALRKADTWAKGEIEDDDTEWKDLVADIYIELRNEFHFSLEEEKIVKEKVTYAIMWLKQKLFKELKGAKL